MAWKHLFKESLGVAPGRLHMAAHSHHLWPDATRAAQLAAWDDAARLADHKWDRVLGEVWPAAQANVAAELGLPSGDSIVFGQNTHVLLLSLLSAMERPRPLRLLTTDGEFHSLRRQAARLAEAGVLQLEIVAQEPWADFADRFIARARSGEHDLILASHVFFKTGRIFDRVFELAPLARAEGPWLVVDGYHAFMAIDVDLHPVADRLFYLAGGYKYAMAGEGVAFMHAPPGFGLRPALTGWYAEFAALQAPAGGVGYAEDARRFLGATFDPSGLYRLNAVSDMLKAEGLTTAAIATHVADLQAHLVALVAAGEAGRLGEAELLNPLDGRPHARFLAWRHPQAAAWKAALDAADVVVDVRDDVLRVGLGLYHDVGDVKRFVEVCRGVIG